MASDNSVNDNEDDSSDLLEKFTFIVVSGLKSDAGKKLNGSAGIILKNKPSEGRYPVRLFAAAKEGGGFQVLETVQDRRLKIENVIASNAQDVLEAFDKATPPQMGKTQASGDNKGTMFWLEANHKMRPELYHYGWSYANGLSIFDKKHSKAADVLYQVFEKTDFKTDKRWPTIYKEAVETFCQGQKYFDKALELALAIPIDDEQCHGGFLNTTHKKLSSDALSKVVNEAKIFVIQGKGLHTSTDDVAQIGLQAARTLVKKHDPQDDIVLDTIAGMFCLAGDNFEGAKMYRRALKHGRPLPIIQSNIILAQMQCPGMPWENYHIVELNPDGGDMTACLKSEKKNLEMVPEFTSQVQHGEDGQLGRGNNGKFTVTNTGDTVTFVRFPMPKDHDDPEYFSELLPKLNSGTE